MIIKFIRSLFSKNKTNEFFKEHDAIKDKWREECPEFSDFEYNKIIEWLSVDNKGEIFWEDTFTNGKKETRVVEELAHWCFSWKFGFIGFMSFKKEDEERAKRAAAMFVWLWLKKQIPAEYASHLAEAYCRNYTFFRDSELAHLETDKK